MAIVIVKNTTGSSVLIDDLGIEVPASGELNLSELFEFEDISGSNDLESLVDNETFVVNDGTIDLSRVDGLKHVYHQTVYEDSFEDGGSGAGGDLSSLQIIRTSGIALSTSWQDVSFDTTNIENNSSVLEHDNYNSDRILIKSDGFYFITYSYSARTSGATRDSESRVRVNDINTLDGSYILQNLYRDETHQQESTFITELQDGDFITLQVKAASTPIQANADFTLNIFKLNGVKGDKGDTGDTGSDGADGEDGIGTGIDVACLQVRRDGVFNPGTSWDNTTFNETDIESHQSIIEHHNTNTDRIVCKESGYYLVTSNLVNDGGKIEIKLLINDTTEINGSYAYSDPSSSDEDGIYNTFIVYIENDNDYITLQARGESSGTDIEYCHVTILKLQGAKGDTGDTGDTGARGEAFSVDEYNDLDESKVTWIENSSGASSSDVYFIVVVDDVRSNQSLPAAISGDMSGHILMYDGTSWNDFGQFTGITGDDGEDGHGWFSGSTNPTSGMYENEDHYLNTTSGEIFKKTSGTWNSIGNLSGPTGPTGADGVDGNSVKIQQDDSDIMSNVAIINFDGDVDISTDPGSKVNVTVGNIQIAQIYDNNGGVNVNNTTPVAISFDEQMYIDDIYNHSTSTNNSRLSITQNGIYRISYGLNWDGVSSRRTVHSFVRKNGTTKIILSDCYDYSRNSTDDKGGNTATFLASLNNGDYIELMGERDGTSGSATTIADQSWLTVELIRGI